MSLTPSIPPTLQWSFDGNATDSITNLSPSSTFGTPTYVTGLYKQAINFPNTSGSAPTNYLVYNTIPTLSNTTGFSFASWINFTQSITNNEYILQLYSGAGNSSFYLVFTSSIVGFRNGTAAGPPLAGIPFVATPRQWYHFALSVTSTTWNMYINGSLQTASGIYSAGQNLTNITGPLWIGAASTGLFGATAIFDDFRLYNTALTSDQVQAIYRQNGLYVTGITRFFSSGGTGISSFSNTTPGSVLAYSYLYTSVVIQGTCAAVDAGSNIYYGAATGVFASAVFPNSFQKVPDQYYSFFPSGGANGALLLKYNKLGKVIGMMRTSGSNQTVSAIKTDAGSNVYVVLSGIIGSTFNVYDINPSNPNLNSQNVPAVTNILKYSPAGKLIGWGGGMSGTTGATFQVSLDSGSNVYMCGYYRNTATGIIYNIASPSSIASGTRLPSTITPSVATGAYWPAIFKWSPTGAFLGYSIIRCQNNSSACVISVGATGQALCPDNSGNMFWGGMFASNLYCNVNSISTTEPISNSYSLNTTLSTVPTSGSNAFVIRFDPSGAVTNIVEIGYGPASVAGRYTWVSGLGISSSGNLYVNGNFSTNAVGFGIPFLNFGLADPKNGSFLTPSSVNSGIVTVASTSGTTFLLCYNISGAAQSVSQHSVSTNLNAAPLIIDKNDSIYQFFSYPVPSFTLQNLGQTSSGLTVPASGQSANYCIAKFNSSGNVIGFSVINNTNGNMPLSMAADSTGVYFISRFLNASGGIANVNAISTTVSLFAKLPTIPSQGTVMIKWAL